ncbi:MAG: MarR family winged helix-turn-helix transcriptional regulator [Elusimicrobiota bacterium]
MIKLQKPARSTPPAFGKSPSDRTARYEFLLNLPAQRIREMTAKILEPLKITPKQYGILAAIHFEGPSAQGAIGEKLKIDRATMVQLMDSLEAKGLAVRQDHPEDRRHYLIHLTPAGRALFQKAQGLVLEVERKFLSPLTKPERQDLRRCLLKLLHYIPNVKKHPVAKGRSGEY